jgi:hypothetical protein
MGRMATTQAGTEEAHHFTDGETATTQTGDMAQGRLRPGEDYQMRNREGMAGIVLTRQWGGTLERLSGRRTLNSSILMAKLKTWIVDCYGRRIIPGWLAAKLIQGMGMKHA